MSDGSPLPPCPRRRPPRRDARPPSAWNSRCPARECGARAGAAVQPSSLERREARAELGENLLLLLEAAARLRHDLGARALGEVGPAELALEEGDLLARALDLLAEPRSLRS